MKRALLLSTFALAAACGAAPCPVETPPAPANDASSAPVMVSQQKAPATPEEAKAFVKQVNEDLMKLWVEAERTSWVKSTYITDDTEALEARANERVMKYLSEKIVEAKRFDGLSLDPDTARSLYLLKYSAGLPAPSDPAKRAELADIASKMEGQYGKGKYCSPKLKGKGKDKKSECLDLEELSDIMDSSHDYDTLLEAWKGWRTISPPMRPMYERFVQLGNEGARELGFSDMSAIWTGGYDMPPAEFKKEMDRLWTQVEPLYDQLFCYVRSRLRKQYGESRIGKEAPIPAHLLGNMWAQEWEHIYPLVEPYPGKGEPDLTKALERKQYTPLKMVKLGESFFTSLGMDPLPKTFWERSLFTKPADRDVVCHASSWDVNMAGDLRIKMCIQVGSEDLLTIHHELGHSFYFHYYDNQPPLFQAGANDGFHEGIGDTMILSVTPSYLAKVGLFDHEPPVNKEADINMLMKRALDGVAFLPFGKLIDEWRWRVFTGQTKPSEYNASWWALRKQYQGVAPPVPRSEADFDPGAKYHVAANVPYMRYFIARILQYQFHRALCKAAGYQGPLYRCSIYGNKEAGKRMIAMLKLGASKPWPEALAAVGAGEKMDATAILDYYKPLADWLTEQNKGQTCDWK